VSYLPSTRQEEFDLRLAARLWQLRADYSDTDKKQVAIKRETLVALLSGVTGVEIKNAATVQSLIKLARQNRISKVLEPVYVVWDSQNSAALKIYLPLSEESSEISCELIFENSINQAKTWTTHLHRSREMKHDGQSYVRGFIDLPMGSEFPIGYHQLNVTIGGKKTSR
jgi:hypothetical protein